MNTHLHLLEAYTNLFRVWPDKVVEERLRELIDLFDTRMPAPSGHYNLFFDADWTVRSHSYTYGHDIEAAWLLVEAAGAIGLDTLRKEVSRRAVDIARAVEREAIDSAGGLAYEGRDGVVIDANREWWPQAEAVLGFWNAYGISGDQRFAGIASRLWEFIRKHMVDRKKGERFWRVFADGSVDVREPKISEWKDPYHGVRMSLKMIRFLED